ncbi:MAG: hypothetical protein AAGH68_10995 [Pseudomonadota bacterium]
MWLIKTRWLFLVFGILSFGMFVVLNGFLGASDLPPPSPVIGEGGLTNVIPSPAASESGLFASPLMPLYVSLASFAVALAGFCVQFYYSRRADARDAQRFAWEQQRQR